MCCPLQKFPEATTTTTSMYVCVLEIRHVGMRAGVDPFGQLQSYPTKVSDTGYE